MHISTTFFSSPTIVLLNQIPSSTHFLCASGVASMRRIEQRCILSVPPAVLSLSRRHARRRQLQPNTNETAHVHDAVPSIWEGSAHVNVQPDVSSLRSNSMMGAPATTSLDKIRAQLALMRTDNMTRAAEEKAALERRQLAEKKRDQEAQQTLSANVKAAMPDQKTEDLSKFILKEFARLNKPNEIFQSAKEIVDGVAHRSFLIRQKRYKDADEVLRKDGKNGDTKRYVKVAFSPTSEETAHLVELVQRMHAQWTAEQEKLLALRSEAADIEATESLAWMQVLEQLKDDEIRSLWEGGVLDVDTLTSLFAELPKDNNGSNAIEDNAESILSLSLEEKMDYVRRLYHIQELTNSVRETGLGSAPPIDLATTLVKVQNRQYADISEKELRHLEQYEEVKVTHLSVDGAANAATVPTGISTKDGRSSGKVDVTMATLDRALLPSNSFLSAVAEKDAALKRSLEAMERIKREVLLDPEFQEAVRFAHAIEEASVAPYLRGIPTGSESAFAKSATSHESGQSDTEVELRGTARRAIMSKRERRATRGKQFRGPMARSPYSPEVVPYFYNDPRSIVPPRGAFNLPDPTPTKVERAEMRGRRRRARQHSHYRK